MKNWFKRSRTSEPTDDADDSNRPLPLKCTNREPGHGTEAEDVFEVWGDMLDCTAMSREEVARLGKRAVAAMRQTLLELLDMEEERHDRVSLSLCSDSQDDHYLFVEWQNMRGEIGARVFGRCLDLFGILVLPRGFATDPNPMVRLGKLRADQRRDIELFQSLLKYVLEQTMEALDEQRIR